MIEEEEKREKRRIGREMEMLNLKEEGKGVVLWKEKGWKMLKNMVRYMRRRIERNGYKEVNKKKVMEK